jgi:hypothetical protein
MGQSLNLKLQAAASDTSGQKSTGLALGYLFASIVQELQVTQ